MPFLPAFFRPKAPYFGTQLVTTAVRIGTGGMALINSTTTAITVPKPAGFIAQLVSIELDALVAGVPNSGDMLAQVFKRDNSGTPANRTLTATKSLTATVVTVTDKTYAFPITSTSVVNCTFLQTDTCRCDVVLTDTVTTQPTVTLVATWALIRAV